ncbi:hypothetical protein ZIOFF_050300 [Zingiber officinale]|uniref:glutaredoxin-dependent peroxiredoxin n=1 Tax=Zingiber officinale TaxID=94328 RepID=A0A8J5FGL8_ZINOF|nr:hypothetical protein ZIOFF_050300 [Zingiber officinale]
MCSQNHLPGFVEKDGELHAKGVDTIACVSVNDASVMHAWKKDLNIRDEVLLLSDRNREFTLALGVELDLSDKPMGLGVQSQRYALLAEDGVVKIIYLGKSVEPTIYDLLGDQEVEICLLKNGKPSWTKKKFLCSKVRLLRLKTGSR